MFDPRGQRDWATSIDGQDFAITNQDEPLQGPNRVARTLQEIFAVYPV